MKTFNQVNQDKENRRKNIRNEIKMKHSLQQS